MPKKKKKSPPVKTSKKRIAIYILTALFFLVPLLVFVLSKMNVEVIEVNGPGGIGLKYIKKEEVPLLIAKVNEITEKEQDEVSILDDLLKSKNLNAAYRDSIRTLTTTSAKKIDIGLGLVDRFKYVNKMDDRQEKEFIEDVLNFLDQNNQLSKERKTMIAMNYLRNNDKQKWDNEKNNLLARINELENMVKSLKDENIKLKKDFKPTLAENKRLHMLYNHAIAEIEELESLLAKQQIQREEYNLPITVDTEELDRLKAEVEEFRRNAAINQDSADYYRKQLKQVAEVSVVNPIWEPVQAKKRKKAQTYVHANVKEIKLSFYLESNYPIDKNLKKLKIVYSIPDDTKGKSSVERNVMIPINQSVNYSLKNKSLSDSKHGHKIKFGVGLYEVEVLDLDSKKSLYKGIFSVQKWLGKS